MIRIVFSSISDFSTMLQINTPTTDTVGMSEKNKMGLSSKEKIVLFALILGCFMTALDATIVSVALPTMAEELGEAGHDTSNISWVLLVYTLMLCCFILLWSKVGTNIGYKKVFVSGVAIFTVSSLAIGLCGFIPQLGLGAIIILRAVQGLGAGMCMAMSLAMVSTYLPQSARGRCIGAVTLASSAGTAFGPALGGLLTTIHWSYIFFINVPIGLICIVLALKYMSVKENIPDEKKKLDVFGAILLFIMLFSLIFYLNQGDDIGWTSYEGIGLILMMFVAAGLVAWWEQKARDPLISLGMIANRQITGSLIVGLLLFMAMGGSYLLLPYYLQFVQGYETIQYGFILVANSVGMMVAGPLVGKIADKTGNNKPFIVLGCLVSALGFFLMTMFTGTTELWFILLALFVMGAGMGMALVAATNFSFTYINKGEDGQLSGLTNTFRQAGSSAGVAILNAIFTSSIIVTADQFDLVPGFKHAFFIAILIALVAFVVSMALKNKENTPSPE